MRIISIKRSKYTFQVFILTISNIACAYSLPPNGTPNKKRKPRNGWKPYWARNSPKTYHSRTILRTVKYYANS